MAGNMYLPGLGGLIDPNQAAQMLGGSIQGDVAVDPSGQAHGMHPILLMLNDLAVKDKKLYDSIMMKFAEMMKGTGGGEIVSPKDTVLTDEAEPSQVPYNPDNPNERPGGPVARDLPRIAPWI